MINQFNLHYNNLKDNFLNELSTLGTKPGTIKLYNTALNHLLSLVESQKISSLNEITSETIQSFAYFLYENKKDNKQRFSSKTQFNYLLFVKKFFLWLVKEKHLTLNPATPIALPKVRTKQSMNFFTSSELQTFYGAIEEKNIIHQRNKIIFKTYYALGLRLAELINLKTADLFLSDRYIIIRKTKTSEERSVPLSFKTASLLKIYTEEIRTQLEKISVPYLFLTKTGKKMASPYVTVEFKKILKKSGINKHLSVHAFRYSIATHLLENGMDIRYIQKFLGHKNIDTTRQYTKVSIENLREVVNTYHPSMRKQNE